MNYQREHFEHILSACDGKAPEFREYAELGLRLLMGPGSEKDINRFFELKNFILDQANYNGKRAPNWLK